MRQESTTTAGVRTDYLTFFVAGEELGVPILRVREILGLDPTTLTRVPSAPACVRGVINLRGGVVPVIDLAVQLNQAPCAITKLTCVVVVEVAIEGALAVMGLLVDAVNQTMELSSDEVDTTPSFGTIARAEYLLGMANAGKKFVMLLDIDRVLSPDELHGAHRLREARPEVIDG
jgi:purine-binding chemotaxis protein CheW